jgi:hypothetical protein
VNEDIRRELAAARREALEREFEDLKRRYGGTFERCPDFVPQAAIDLLAQSHRKMAITCCQHCGETTRQFPWLLDQPSTYQVCKALGL